MLWRPDLSPGRSAAADGTALVFDGDDTLWEDNSRFERVIETFLAAVRHPTLDTVRLRDWLNRIEARTCSAIGYGVASFERSLGEFWAELAADGAVFDPVAAAADAWVAQLCGQLRDQPVQLIDGVADTLERLARRHTLYLLTKGDEADQRRKIKESGLDHHFAEHLVVPEKRTDTYTSMLDHSGLEARSTWMVGNSPRSDILPALAAGLNAVLVPHQETWMLELAELPPPDDRFVVVDEFRRLLELF